MSVINSAVLSLASLSDIAPARIWAWLRFVSLVGSRFSPPAADVVAVLRSWRSDLAGFRSLLADAEARREEVSW